jgi:hypothetical protein
VEIDFDEAIILCRRVRGDLDELFDAIRGREFFDIGYEIGNMARSGMGFERMIPELEELEKCLHERCPSTFNDTYARIYDLVNYYDHLNDLIQSNKEYYRKGERMHAKLMEWRSTAGRFAQLVCHLDGD